MNLRRDWPITVMSKDCHGGTNNDKYYSVTIKPGIYAENEPPWATRTWDGAPLRLNVTREEWDRIEVGDTYTISIR